MNLRVWSSGNKENAEELQRMGRAMIDGVQQDLEALGDQIVADVNSNIQDGGHVVTGDTLSHTQVFETGFHWIEVGNDAEWIRALEDGRGPVVPVNAKVLHFIAKDGTEVFTNYSGPTEATHVVESGVLKNTEGNERLLVQRVDREIG